MWTQCFIVVHSGLLLKPRQTGQKTYPKTCPKTCPKISPKISPKTCPKFSAAGPKCEIKCFVVRGPTWTDLVRTCSAWSALIELVGECRTHLWAGTPICQTATRIAARNAARNVARNVARNCDCIELSVNYNEFCLNNVWNTIWFVLIFWHLDPRTTKFLGKVSG